MEQTQKKFNLSELFAYKGHWKFEVRDAVTGELKRTYEADNLVPTVGKSAHASQWTTSKTKDIGDNMYIACGSNATAPAVADTQLGTEVCRKAISSVASAGAVASIAVFFSATEATGTHREFGLFGDGGTTACSVTANTGVLYSHVACNVTVGATETLTVTFTITYA